MQKKAQVAMEFLMTYGWALLVVLVAIGALAFFGVLNPSGFLPEQCLLGPGLACEDYKAINDGNSANPDNPKIRIKVRNGMGKDLDIFVIYVDKENPAGGTEVCGGYAAVIAFPNPSDPAYVANVPLFRDGTAREIISATNIALGTPGLNCNNQPRFPDANCCMQLNTIPCVPPGLCPICDNQYRCYPSTITKFPSAGERFSSDIVIVYRELGSAILHARIGKLTTKVE